MSNDRHRRTPIRPAGEHLADPSTTETTIERTSDADAPRTPPVPTNVLDPHDPMWVDMGSSEEISLFAPWFRAPPRCSVNAVHLTQVYSRGNNDQPEMTAQKAKTGTTYQYETGKFELDLATSSSCICVGNNCVGAITITLGMKIILTAPYSATSYTMLDGVESKTPTVPKAGAAVPLPDVTVVLDKVDLPASTPANDFKQTDPTKTEFFSTATATIPCTAGTYAKRFFIVSKATAGTKGYEPGGGLTAFVDVILTVTSPGGCKLQVDAKMYLLEFHPTYDFTHGGACPKANEELPEVDSTRPNGAKGSSNNIAKLVSQDGNPVDTPFVPK